HAGDQAERIWEFVLAWEPDVVVDLHEGYGFRAAGSKSVGSSVITSRAADHPRRAMLLEAVNADIDDPERRFVALGPPVAGSLVRAASERLGIEGHLFETTHASQPLSTRCRQHRRLVASLLTDLGMADDSAGRLVDPAERRGVLALFDGGGTGPGTARFEEILPLWRVERVGPADIADGALSQFDALLFPGGSGSGQARALGEAGRGRVRAFVARGGAFVGVCAGAYLAMDNYSWGLRLIALDSHDREHWRRGKGTVRMELEAAGAALFGGDAGAVLDVHFAQGPMMVPAQGPPPDDAPERTAPEILARFVTGVGENGADPQMMVGMPAAARAGYGAGRVLLFSPHPEKTDGLEPAIGRGLAWAAGTDLVR
ncbi:MAG: BPL-N domain-containing protein, partial [Planctomycetota bacterium]|nr:BPL-N domain-containing protein [Planctomycetota bacterium]